MRYFGGKARISNKIAKELYRHRASGQLYIEPFMGAGWVMHKMGGSRLGCDKHPYLIAMWKALQDGWIPPKSITEEEYYSIRENQDEIPHLAGFIGFGCSHSGKWWGGYAKDGNGRNYCLNAHNSIMKKLRTMKGVEFQCCDYHELEPSGALVYCDPPYQDTTGYGTGPFDHDEFWNVVRKWSQSNTVIVSEYIAPEDFECILEIRTKTDMRNASGDKESRIERLFKIRD